MAFNQLNALDFNDIKASIKDYIKSSNIFSDYNFEGSVISNIVDILAYNTYYNSFNANLIVNETFLDSAILRENVVRLAKLLNYTPKSIKSSKAVVTITVNLANNPAYTPTTYPNTLTLKAGVVFNAYNENGNFIFSIPNEIVRPVNKTNGTVVFENIPIYEGNLITTSYVVDNTSLQKYIIPNPNTDTDTLTVKVFPTLQSNASVLYTKSTDFVGLTSESPVYFIQEIQDQTYELIFGDGVFGKKLENNNSIQLSYIVCSGAVANGCSDFTGGFIGTIVDTNNNVISNNIQVVNKQTSLGGGDAESIDSIKYNAPRFYQTQGRAVTAKDYETLVPLIYSNVESVSVYGGEDDLPPQYGVVNLVIKPKIGLKLSDSEKLVLRKELANYAIGSVVPQIKDPSIIYIVLKSVVYYNSLLTTKTSDQIKQDVINSVVNLNQSRDFNKFGGKFKYSKLLNIIDNTNTAITSNITKLKLKKYLLVTPNVTTSYRTCFSNVIANFSGSPTVTSSGFKLLNQDQNKVFYFEDDTNGNLKIFYIDETNVKNYLPTNNVRANFGKVNYETGEIIVDPINITATINTNNTVSLFVTSNSNDIISLRDTYLTIDTNELEVSIVNDYISEGRTNSAINITPFSSY